MAIGGHGNQEFMLNTFINLKFGMGFEIFPHCGFRIVAFTPRAIALEIWANWRLCWQFGLTGDRVTDILAHRVANLNGDHLENF